MLCFVPKIKVLFLTNGKLIHNMYLHVDVLAKTYDKSLLMYS